MPYYTVHMIEKPHAICSAGCFCTGLQVVVNQVNVAFRKPAFMNSVLANQFASLGVDGLSGRARVLALDSSEAKCCGSCCRQLQSHFYPCQCAVAVTVLWWW